MAELPPPNPLPPIDHNGALTALAHIHARMCIPFYWSADTPDAIAEVLTNLGFTFPEEDESEDLKDTHGDEIPLAALEQWWPHSDA